MSGKFFPSSLFIYIFIYLLKFNVFFKVYFHGNNFNSLHKYLSPSILPKYFEGTLEFEPITWVRQFLNKEHYFEGKNI